MTTPYPFRFDGHGINDANGQRVAKVSSCEPYVYPDGRPERNKEFDELSKLFAKAPEMRDTLKALLNWANYMGGFEGSEWKDAFDIIEQLEGRDA
jgi:hypothetical protein